MNTYYGWSRTCIKSVLTDLDHYFYRFQTAKKRGISPLLNAAYEQAPGPRFLWFVHRFSGLDWLYQLSLSYNQIDHLPTASVLPDSPCREWCVAFTGLTRMIDGSHEER